MRTRRETQADIDSPGGSRIPHYLVLQALTRDSLDELASVQIVARRFAVSNAFLSQKEWIRSRAVAPHAGAWIETRAPQAGM